MGDLADVLFEQTDDVGVLTLNRPARLNALSGRMIGGALEIVTDLSRRRAVRALVVTGAGRGFCSGADLGGDARLEGTAGSLGAHMREGINPLVAAICEAPFPVVAAVNGPAAGAGVGLALATDFLVASASMQLLLTFSRIGMGLDAGTSWFLAHLLGLKRAAAVALLVEPIDAQRAKEWGLAYSVVPDDELMSEAMGLAERLAQGPTRAYAAQKKQLRAALDVTLEEALDSEATVQDGLIRSEDLKEGVRAFRERRTPIYSGR